MKRKIFLLIVVLLVPWLWYKNGLRPADAGSEVRTIVEIPSGSSFSRVASILEDKGVVRSSLAFNWYGRIHNLQSKVQAGTFVFKPSMTVDEIIEALSGKVSDEASITIPEGYTVKDIDALLTKKGIIKAGELSECARTCDFSTFEFLSNASDLADRGGKVEGYLYPDTYFVLQAEFVPKFFIERLLGTFRKRVADGLVAEIKTSGRTLDQIMIMASLIEEETRTDEERPVVAGILWKRFDAGMGLGVDAAVRYILDKPSAAITKDDLEIESPYNLRKYRGLPPGPIANPSLSSIKAAIAPEASSYWYYLHGTDGQIRYAVTNDEHNQNRARYLK